MKYLSLIIVILFLTTCGSLKRTVESTPKETQKEAIVETKAFVPPETAKIEQEQIDIEVSAEKKNEEQVIVEAKEKFDHSLWNTLLQKYVSKSGNVNYKEFKTDDANFSAYLNLLSENKPNDTWSKEEKLAYWINAYNAFTIKLILDNYPIKSIRDIDKPWDYRFIKIGEKMYSLNDIEHQILRKMNEPRIHFAIVCASVSCPKLINEAFIASKLEAQLANATKDFLSDTSKNNISKNSIKLSKIFKWFADDFKINGSLISFINQYTTVTIEDKAKKSFNDYNWNLNE